MNLFGFEEDLDVHNSEIISRDAPSKPVTNVTQSNDIPKLTISQIQDLLVKDLNESVSDQSTFPEDDTSIYEDTAESAPLEKPKLRLRRAIKKIIENSENNCSHDSETRVRPRRVVKKVLGSIENTSSTLENDNTTQSEFVIPATRAYVRPTRRKKVLQSIENTTDTPNSSAVKCKRNNRKKVKAKNDENAKVDTIAAEINNKFREVEQYKLVVE